MADTTDAAAPTEQQPDLTTPQPDQAAATPSPTETVTPEAAIKAAIAEERARVSAITTRCKQVGMSHLADSLIDGDADMAACNAAIVDEYVAVGGPETRQTTSATSKADTTAAAREQQARDAYATINQQFASAIQRPE